jgi:hypothetical protein
MRSSLRRISRKPAPWLAVLAVGALLAAGTIQARPGWAQTNLALNKPASGSGPCASTEGPEKAVNGSVSGGNGDKWCSLADGTKRLQVDLETSPYVSEVIVRHAGAGGESEGWNTRDFTVQTSTNGTTFTTVASVHGNTASVTSHGFTPRPVRYLRLDVTAPTSDGSGAARIYELEAYSDTPPTPTPTPSDPQRPDPPAVIADDYVSDHNTRMTRVGFNNDVALYFDPDMPGSASAWVLPLVTNVWRYLRATYGACAVPRPPDCENFGPKHLYAFAHEDKYHGGTVNNRFDEWADWRNTIDAGDNGWSQNNDTLRDVLTHEICHIVEGANNGVHESPAFEVWGDSKWAEFCQYDIYTKLGMTADANRVYTQFTNNRDGYPRPNTAWFRDWFYPMWRDYGGAQVMVKFFGLLSQHFPKVSENNGRNLVYSRRMNLGEFIHFMSGAAGTNLSARATTAFGTAWQGQFNQARQTFPGITYPG